jgi:hypothetical protein
MFEDDPSMEERLQCDIEMDCTNSKAVAWVLRDLTSKIEQEAMDSGHHDILVPNGDKVGEIYLDYYAKTDL